MKDLILSNFSEQFTKAFALGHLEAKKQFEYFVNHCVLTKDYAGAIPLEDITSDSAYGIDGAAVFVNDFFVTDTDELDGVAKHRIEARFVFIQGKTSPSIDLGELLKFLTAVEGLFAGQPVPEQLSEWAELKDAIYKNALKFDKNPKLELYFAYAGSYKNNPLFEQQISAAKDRLAHTNLFSDVAIRILDADSLKGLFRSISNKIVRSITFQRQTTLPKIEGVKRAYIGILPWSEYVKLITDSEGRLNRKLFYDNVRDYQGENTVNREVIETIVSEPHGRERFVLLNNGVTVVAQSINPVGDEFTIRDYQIVNGCQTSHILFNNVKRSTGNEFVTLKLIETEDSDLANKITKATNRQTGVTNEAFAALEPFHKEIESYFDAVAPARRLYYERRSGQFDWDKPIDRTRIITVPQQIKSFLAVILEEPHKVHFYYGQLLDEYNQGKSALFIEGHDPSTYYLAAWIVSLVSQKYRGKSYPLGVAWRYHIALAIRLLAGGQFNQNRLSDSRYCQQYCEKVISQLEDTAKFSTIFEVAMQKVVTLRAAFKRSFREVTQEHALTTRLVRACLSQPEPDPSAKPASVGSSQGPITDTLFVGTIDSIAEDQDAGFICYGHLRLFFRPSKALASFKVSPPIGTRVRFRIRRENAASEASEITLLK